MTARPECFLVGTRVKSSSAPSPAKDRVTPPSSALNWNPFTQCPTVKLPAVVLKVSFLQMTVLYGWMTPAWDVSRGHSVCFLVLSGLLRALVLWPGGALAFHPSLFSFTAHSVFVLFSLLGPTPTRLKSPTSCLSESLKWPQK